MKKWFHRSLKNQLILFMLIALFVPVFFLGIISYLTSFQLSKERAEISGQSSLEQLENSIEFIVDDALGMSVFLIGSHDVQDYMEKDTSTPQQRSNITGFLSNLAYSKDYISNITLYPLGRNPNLSTNTKHAEQDLNIEQKENKWWTYRSYEETVSGVQETVTLTRPVRSMSDFKDIGYLTISLNQEYLDDLLNSIDWEWDGTVLLSKDQLLLASNKDETIDDMNVRRILENVEDNEKYAFYPNNLSGDKSTIFSTTISEVDWNLVGVIPYKEYSAQNRYLLWFTFIAIIVASIFILLFVYFYISKVIDPLILLTKALQNTAPGEKIEGFTLESENEIGNLMTSYNKLNDRISILMERVKNNEAIKRQIDLQALQKQINPHFLYNTLASIHWTALEKQSQEISKMVSSLSLYLRYSLNKGSEFCTVEQEMEHLNQYIYIQEIRFPNQFHILSDIPPEVKQHKILKLVLQPLVENSMIHGKKPGSKLHIFISVDVYEGQLQCKVSDDGQGISRKKMIQLQTQFENDIKERGVTGRNYGLRNVNLRLAMHYGYASGLSVSNRSDIGVVISFTIPLERERS